MESATLERVTSHPSDPSPAPAPIPREVPLRKGRLWLEADGFRYAPGAGTGILYPYRDITHLGTAERGIWIGTRQGSVLLPRARFEDRDYPELVADWLVLHIRSAPGGSAQMARIAAVDELVRSPMPRIATSVLAVLCALGMALQFYEPFLGEVATFAPSLVAAGEWWRIWTGNFLHSPLLFPLHLVSNLVLILGFALLVERPLGAVATTVILGASVMGAMAFAALAGYEQVIGASGIAAGLVGAVLCLDLYFSEYLPAWWRLPRRLFITVLLLQLVLDFALPIVAGAAHVGGFVGGFLVTQWVAGAALRRAPQPRWVKLSAAAVVATLVLSVVVALPLLQRDGEAMARHARVLLGVPNIDPLRYNEIAWRMATESHATHEQLLVALEVAERAVYESDRADPDILDTLAEVQYVVGDQAAALRTIDEAISLSVGEPYFVEQRRRFLGERDWNDRPAPPVMPWFLRDPNQSEVGTPLAEPGIEV